MTAREDLETLTVEEAAELLKVSRETIRRYVRDDHLSAMHWGGRIRFYLKDIQAFQQKQRIRPSDAAALVNERLKRHRPAAGEGGGA